MLEPPKAVATSSHVIMHRITMGNQQATLMTTLSSITSAEFIGCFLVVSASCGFKRALRGHTQPTRTHTHGRVKRWSRLQHDWWPVKAGVVS